MYKAHVELLQASDLEIAFKAARICYHSEHKSSPENDRRLIRQIIKSGHESVIEHIVYTFLIENVSRITSHQFVRHRIASYSQQSQRYVEQESIVIPTDLEDDEDIYEIIEKSYNLYSRLLEKGIKKEIARYVLPQGSSTRLIATFNARSLRNLFKQRLAKSAQLEIRLLATAMFDSLPDEHKDVLFFDIKPLRYNGTS